MDGCTNLTQRGRRQWDPEADPKSRTPRPVSCATDPANEREAAEIVKRYQTPGPGPSSPGADARPKAEQRHDQEDRIAKIVADVRARRWVGKRGVYMIDDKELSKIERALEAMHGLEG